MKKYPDSRKRSLSLTLFLLIAMIIGSCSGVPAGQDEPGLTMVLSEDLPPGTPVFVSPQDSHEFTRRIAAASENELRGTGRTESGIEVLLSSRLKQREDRGPAFLSKRYEIYLDGMLVNQVSEQVGSFTGRLVYKRTRIRLAVTDEAEQFDMWDRDFVEWSAQKIREALTF
ncbi:hypothetical protein [Marispirochaeta sp.]|jgi:hypothetical protein|uniref:hypothetical protein n=1 Tax=Marispirochaeta sp. TaxID=2038653 RepID=UPI0029C81F8E|nr:hypothetical protein [Marispirochaeta sp.]